MNWIPCLLVFLLTTACLDAGGRSATTDDPEDTDTPNSGDDSALAAQVAALTSEVEALASRVEAAEAEAAALRAEVDAQSEALDAALATIDGLAGEGDGLTALTQRLEAVEARGAVETVSGSGTGTCAYLSMDVMAGRPVVVVASVRATGNYGYWNTLYGYGGSVSASVSASGSGASASASLSAAGYTATSTGFYTSGWTGSDSRAFSVVPSSDGEVVVSMSSSVSSAYGSLPAPTVDSCSLTAVQL
jgi:outer membrane murein-binding lipoprotein Lpp